MRREDKFTGVFNRGFDRLSHGYGNAAGFVIELVRAIESIALDTPGIVKVGAFAGLSGATRTQAGKRCSDCSSPRSST